MRKLVKMLFLGIVIAVVPLHAQITFEKWYGGPSYEYANTVDQTADGGYIIAGFTLSYGAGTSDVYLVKTDAYGDTVWTKTYGRDSGDCSISVAQTSDGGYIVVGWTESWDANCDVWLIKIDASGDTIWTKTYGGGLLDSGVSVAQTIDGGYIIAGYTESYGAGDYDVYLIKTDAYGDTIWTRTYGGFDMEIGLSVAQTADSGYIIVGYTDSYGAGSFDVYLIKTDSVGDTAWTKTYGGTNVDIGVEVAQTTDNGYIIAGYTYSYGAGDYDVYLIKTDADGNSIWTRTYGSDSGDCGNSVAQTADGGYIIAGWTNSHGAGLCDVYLIKTNSVGDTAWTKTYGGVYDETGNSMALTTDGGYVIAGYTDSYGSGGDFYLIKTDANGNGGINEKEAGQRSAKKNWNLCTYPNPFSMQTNIRLTIHDTRYTIPDKQNTTLMIFDVTGRLVKDLSSDLESGIMEHILWSGTDQSGRAVPPGVYFVRLGDGSAVTEKIVKTK